MSGFGTPAPLPTPWPTGITPHEMTWLGQLGAVGAGMAMLGIILALLLMGLFVLWLITHE